MSLRLLTLNLQHGRPAIGSADAGRPPSRQSLERAAAEIAAIGADVVLLQEVDRNQARSGGVDQGAVLAGVMGLGYHRFAPSLAGSATSLRVPPRRAWAERLPGYGVALLSRYPVRSWHVLRLRGAGLRLRRGDRLGWSLAGVYPVLDTGRVCLAAVVSTPDGPLSVATTHLSTEPATARSQLRRSVTALQTLPAPHVIGGDLNLGPDDAAAASGLTALAEGLTFTNVRPRRQIDHLLAGPGVRADGPGRVHHLPISDHAGLSVDITIG